MAHSERQRSARDPIIVYPFLDWCKMRGISVATGRRLIAAGRVKVTDLSDRRIGIRSDHDREYLDSCLRDSA
jgi:predicted site-specific integrase-resolvase